MSASTGADRAAHGNNRVKSKSVSGWAAFDHKQKQKQQGFEVGVDDSEAYPLLLGPIPVQILPNKTRAPLEKPFSSVVIAPMNFLSLTGTHDEDLQRRLPFTNSCSGSAHNIETPTPSEAYQKLNHLHPWADQSLIQDILAAVNNNIQDALSLLEAMLISEDRDTMKNNANSSNGNDAVKFKDSCVESSEDASSRLLLETATKPPVEKEPEWEEDDVYLNHRKDAIRAMRSASRHSKAANDAYIRGDRLSAHLFSLKAQEEWTNAEKLNAKAATDILILRNDKNDIWTLDLHGLHAVEAVQALQEHLQKVESLVSSSFSAMPAGENKESASHVKMKKFGIQNSTSRVRPRLLQVITGKGNHSRGAAALPIAIRNFLSESRYHFDETRSGVIMIRPKFRRH